MTLRRLFVGVTVVFGLSVWSWCRAGEWDSAPAEPAHSAHAAAAEESDEGNHDEAAHRYRTSQASHWRHVMIGGR